MRIGIVCNHVLGGWCPADDFIRGSEEYVKETALEFQKMGHEVTVFHNGRHGMYSGIVYIDRQYYEGGYDYCLIVKDIEMLRFKNKKTIYYTNDVNDGNRLDPETCKKADAIVALSQYQKDYILPQATHVIGHGVDVQRYKKRVKDPNLCIYSSSPDRGLDDLIEIWKEVKRLNPSLVLEVCYDGRNEEEMDDLYRRATYWLHPCTGIELFCISGQKAIAAGCIPVFYPFMALDETIKCGVRTDKKNFALDLVLLSRDSLKRRRAQQKVNRQKVLTHEDIAKQLLSL